MSVVALIVVGVLSAIGAILLNAAGNEFYDWLPSVARHVVRRAAQRFKDERMRARAKEEWLRLIDELPGHMAKVLNAWSLFLSVERIEFEWRSRGIDEDTVHFLKRLDEDAQAVFGLLRDARNKAGLSLRDISSVTYISEHYLAALEKGDVTAVARVFLDSYAAQFARVVGLPVNVFLQNYYNLFKKRHGGLPPFRGPRATLLARMMCAVRGHRDIRWTLHSNRFVTFHWCYEECARCRRTTEFVSDMCRCKAHGFRRLDLSFRDMDDEAYFD
jgi:hypothetical protein